MKTNTALVLVSAIVTFVATGCAASVQAPIVPVDVQVTVEEKPAMWHGPDGETLPIQYPIDLKRHGHLLTVR